MERDSITIHTLRHGQTDFNVQKRYAGTIDVPLNQSGKESCLEASKAFSGQRYDVVITSALKRTIETAQLLLGEGISLVQSELCNERNYGRMQGLTSEEVEFLEPPILYIKAGGDFHSLNPPGGESFEELRRRAERFRLALFNGYAGANVMVVSHGVFLQQFHGLLRGQNWNHALARSVPNLVVSSFCMRGETLERETSTFLLGYDQSGW